jgi:tetratricopeptide (TPR) repeat protein
MTDRDKLVPFSRGRRRPDPARVAEFAATARKLQHEREQSAEIVARLLRETPKEKWPALAQREELRNSGALEVLSQECLDRRHSAPLDALAIARIATTIADEVSDYPPVVLAQLRAHAWKDLGQVLNNISRADDALGAVEHADAVLADFGTLAHDRAIVRLVRACLLQDVQRYDEAVALLEECKSVFRDHGDQRRFLICGVAEGALLHRMGHFREAREAFFLLLDEAEKANDHESLASLHNNIGHSSVELGDFDTAEKHLAYAIEILRSLGEPLRVARAELARGRLIVRRGEIDRGIAHLRATRDQFLRHRLVEEAGLCALDVVEALLTRGAALEAEQLARTVVAEFTSAQLSTRAITALGYLTEAISARKASPATAANVRQYIDALRSEPERVFVATA